MVVYFVWSAIYICCLWLVNRSWEKVIFFGFWPIQLFNVGQLYVFQLIKPEELNHPLYPNGQNFYFKFTPYLALCVAILVTWVVKVFGRKVKSNLIIILLWLIVGAGVYSTVGRESAIPVWIRALGIVDSFGLIVWLWWFYNYYLSIDERQKQSLWRYFGWIVKVVLLIGSVMIISQGLLGRTLGSVVEQTRILPFFGAGSDEEAWFIRPIGYYGNSNGMAHLIFLQLVALFLVELKVNRKKSVMRPWLLMPILALFWLQSRTVILGLVVMGWWWWIQEGAMINWSKIKIKSRWVMLGLVIVTIMATTVVSVRLWDTVLNTGKNSGVYTRKNLVMVAENLIKKNPWWGVGSNNFVSSAFRNDLTGVFKYFPEPVHNGFLLIWSERGLVGLSLWLLFIWRIICLVNKNLPKKNYLLINCFLATEMLMMMFQPFMELINLPMVLVMLLLADVEFKEL